MVELKPTVSVIVVSYNTRQTTLDCLRAAYAALDGIAAEVFVVDNASSDGSARAIRETFPGATCISNERNVGFGAANNQAMRLARGEYLLLLNSDAFPEPGAIWTLTQYLRARPEVAAVGPRLIDGTGELQISCFPFPTPARAWLENLWIARTMPHTSRLGDYRQWRHDSERLVDWVIGACLLARRSVYEQVGGFDERFFMYAEESDWQRRIRDAGWEIGFTPAARVMHLGGASGAADKPKINRAFFESLDYYCLKHHGLWGLVLFRIAMVYGAALRLPLWAGVLVLRPARRAVALGKIRLLAWLFLRQSTHWAFPQASTV